MPCNTPSRSVLLWRSHGDWAGMLQCLHHAAGRSPDGAPGTHALCSCMSACRPRPRRRCCSCWDRACATAGLTPHQCRHRHNTQPHKRCDGSSDTQPFFYCSQHTAEQQHTPVRGAAPARVCPCSAAGRPATCGLHWPRHPGCNVRWGRWGTAPAPACTANHTRWSGLQAAIRRWSQLYCD
jgi:hypothetical protein